MPNPTPDTIVTILRQMGRGISWCGGQRLSYNCTGPAREGGYPNPSEYTESGYLKSDCYVQFDPNVKRAQTWRFVITYEPSDTYTVRLLRINGPATIAKTMRASSLVDELAGVYYDMLQGVIERMYDDAIRAHNKGFINL